MTDGIDSASGMTGMVGQLMHLKRYERPDGARMVRNRQNIMREVRELQRNRRKSLGDLLELNMPWFFAEPRYGIAALFVAFAALQYVGINARHSARSQTGIYTNPGTLTAYDRTTAPAYTSTNTISYPNLPGNVPLFQDNRFGRGDDVQFVGRIEAGQ